MIETTLNKDQSKVNRIYPFLSNFPFNNDFEIRLMEFTRLSAFEEFEDFPKPPTVVNFLYNNGPVKAEVSIFENEMNWLDESASRIVKLDIISKKIEKAIKSKNILIKKDTVLEAEEWMKSLTDGKNMLSHEIYTDALKAMLMDKSISDISAIVNAINKLVKGTGLVRLSVENASTILTYLHFRLIYVKLILGIVIASKLSI